MKLIEQKDGKKIQVTCVSEEEINVEDIQEIAQLEMDELMSIQCDENIVYSCSSFTNLSNRLESPINRFDFHMMIAQIAQMYKIAKHLNWNASDVIWNSEYVYMSPTTREVKFIYLPNNNFEGNAFTTLLENIIYSAIQSNPEDTFLSEFVYYLKRLGEFSTEDIIEYVADQDSKVARLLQLSKPISYKKPEKEKVTEVVEDTVPEKMEEEAEIEEEIIEEYVADVVQEELEEEKQEDEEIDEIEVVEEMPVEEVLEPVEETDSGNQPIIEEEIMVEDSVTEEPIVKTEEVLKPRLSFSDLFGENSNLQEEYFDIDLDDNINLDFEEDFQPIIEEQPNEEKAVDTNNNAEEAIPTIEDEEIIFADIEETVVEEVEEPIVEEIVEESVEEVVQEEIEEELEESTQEIIFEQKTVEEIVAEQEVEEPEVKKGYVTRLSTEQKSIIDLDEFVIGKSNFVNGMVIKGNPGVSRKHAMIRIDEGQYFIRDLDSVNGTYINDVFVEPETEVQILDGDTIKLGDEELLFTIE